VCGELDRSAGKRELRRRRAAAFGPLAGPSSRVRRVVRRRASGSSMVAFLGALVIGAVLGVLPVRGADPGLYRSNAAGMALETIGEGAREEHTYVLEVDEEPGNADSVRRVERLTRKGEPYRLVEAYLIEGRTEREVIEEMGERRVRHFDDEGRLAEEEIEGRDGETEYVTYRYDGTRRIERIVADGEGKERYRDRYAYGEEGTIRRIVRSFAEGGERRSEFSVAEGRLIDEWHGSDGDGVLMHYDRAGRLVRYEEWVENEPAIREERRYVADDRFRLKELIRDDLVREVRTITAYDEQGRRASEVDVELDEEGEPRDEPIRRTEFTYEDERLALIEHKRNGDTEQIRYEYDAEGNRTYEERLINDELRVTVEHRVSPEPAAADPDEPEAREEPGRDPAEPGLGLEEPELEGPELEDHEPEDPELQDEAVAVEAPATEDRDGEAAEELDPEDAPPPTEDAEHADRIETRYRDGEPILRIYYRDDRVIREDVILDGEVIRVRRFE